MDPGKKRSKATASRKQSRKSTNIDSSDSSSAQQQHITIKDDFASYLNEVLSLENASADRLQSRIMETGIKESKAQLQHHLEETGKQQDRLKQLIIALGGKPTEDKAELLMPSSPKSITSLLRDNKPHAYSELIKAREDAVVESIEIVYYYMLLQLAQKVKSVDAIDPLSLNMSEERSMAQRITTTSIPSLIAQLRPNVAKSTMKQAEENAEKVKKD
jgi:ferritin-like metal-binding protein YciE